MIYIPNRQYSPDVSESPRNWDMKDRGYGFWDIAWVCLDRYEENESISRVSRLWWCKIYE